MLPPLNWKWCGKRHTHNIVQCTSTAANPCLQCYALQECVLKECFLAPEGNLGIFPVLQQSPCNLPTYSMAPITLHCTDVH